MDSDSENEQVTDLAARKLKRKWEELKAQDSIRYFLQYRYDLPDDGRWSKPQAAMEFFLQAIPSKQYFGTWCYEDKKKNGDPSKRHIHVNLAVDVNVHKYDTWDKFKSAVSRYWNTKVKDDHGNEQPRGKFCRYIWREGKPAVYALPNCSELRDLHGHFRYPLKWSTEETVDSYFINKDAFTKAYPDFNIAAERLIAIQQTADAAERAAKFAEKAARKTTLQCLLEEYETIEFSNIRQIYDKVLKYHIDEKLNVVDNQIIMYVKTIALHHELISYDEYFAMLMKKF